MGLLAVFICYPPPGMGYVANYCLCAGIDVDMLVNVDVLHHDLLPAPTPHIR